MFIFGHIGIGRKLAEPWRARLPTAPLILGTLLPDLIDKPLYYSQQWDFVSSTRTLGHTGLLLLLIAGFAWVRRSPGGAALGLGVATHLVLDLASEMFSESGMYTWWRTLSWPLASGGFVTYLVPSVSRHLEELWVLPVIAGEVAGLALLGWDLWKRRRQAAPQPL